MPIPLITTSFFFIPSLRLTLSKVESMSPCFLTVYALS